MDDENSLQREIPKTRTGIYETTSSPKVGQEPDFSEARTGSVSQSVRMEAAAETEQEPERSNSLEYLTRTALSDFENESEHDQIQQTTTTGPVVEMPDKPKRLESHSGPPRELNGVEKLWLAGVIDGEGSIFIAKVTGKSVAKRRRGFSYAPAISLSSSNEAFVRKVKEVIGSGSVNFFEEKRLDWKDKWCYRGSSQVLRGLLPQLVPHLLIKREAAERMLQYLDFIDENPIDGPMEIPSGYYAKVDSLYLALKETNEKGKDVSAEVLTAMLSLPKSLKNRGRGGRATDCRKMTEGESIWLAGVVDGEGSVFLSKVMHPAYRRGYFYRPQLNVSNSNRQFLVKVMEIIGEGTVHLARKGNNSTRTRWEYNATAGVLRMILPQIIKHLIIKRVTAEKIMEYLEFVDSNRIKGKRPVPSGYYERLDGLYWTIKKLNEKGKSVSESGGAS
jgi:hypothetical protein